MRLPFSQDGEKSAPPPAMSIEPGINLEFIRCEDRPFAAGVARAVQLGYRYVEPMVHNGRELLSEAGYFHSFSMDNDPLEMKDILQEHGVKASGLSAHIPLMRPEISVPYLEKAIRLAAGRFLMGPDGGMQRSPARNNEVLDARPVAKHPILEGVGELKVADEAYKGMWLSPKAQVLMETSNPNNDKAVVWIGPWRQSRVVAIQLGHGAATHRDAGYRKLVRNAVLWAAGRQ